MLCCTRVGALVYDSEARWVHTLDTLDTLDQSDDTCFGPDGLWLEALACNSVPALCSLYNSRVRQPGSGSSNGFAWMKMMQGVERGDGRFRVSRCQRIQGIFRV